MTSRSAFATEGCALRPGHEGQRKVAGGYKAVWQSLTTTVVVVTRSRLKAARHAL